VNLPRISGQSFHEEFELLVAEQNVASDTRWSASDLKLWAHGADGFLLRAESG